MKHSDVPAKKAMNPQALKRLELVSLISKTGLVTLSNATVGNWIAAGCPRNADGSLSLLMLFAWREAQHRKKVEKPASSAIEGLRKKQTELADFKLKKSQGEYYERPEVIALFEEAGARMRAVLEAVERNHGPSVGQTIREAIQKSFSNIEEALNRETRARKPA